MLWSKENEIVRQKDESIEGKNVKSIDDRIMIIRGNAWDRGVSSSGTPQPPDGLCPTTDVSINLSSTETSKEAASAKIVKMTFGTLGIRFYSFDIRFCH